MHFAMRKYEKAYWKKDPSQWWEGYCGQKTVVWYGFGDWSRAPTDILSIISSYPYHVRTHGYHTEMLRTTEFILISKLLPCHWWYHHQDRVPVRKITTKITMVYWFHRCMEHPTVYTRYHSFQDAVHNRNTIK